MKALIVVLIVTKTMYPSSPKDTLSITPFYGEDAMSQCETVKKILLEDQMQGVFGSYNPFADHHAIRCRTEK